MKKKLVFSLILPILFAGCASSPAPNYINGKYYMAGDDNCIQGRTNSQGDLVCRNSKGLRTEIRRPISEMQAKAWYDRQTVRESRPSYRAPTQTYCNNIAGIVMCSSY